MIAANFVGYSLLMAALETMSKQFVGSDFGPNDNLEFYKFICRVEVQEDGILNVNYSVYFDTNTLTQISGCKPSSLLTMLLRHLSQQKPLR